MDGCSQTQIIQIFLMCTASREASPSRAPKLNGNGVLVNGNHHSSDENLHSNGHATSEYSDDEYIDTVEVCI